MRTRTLGMLIIGLVALATTACTPREIALWKEWHSNDPAAAEEFVRNLPPAPAPASGWSGASTGSSCTGLIPLLQQYNPGWDVNRMASIAYRESRCQPSAANSCCTGLLQIHYIWIPKAASCGVYSRSDLQNAAKNICTAAIIFRSQGMGAWSL